MLDGCGTVTRGGSGVVVDTDLANPWVSAAGASADVFRPRGFGVVMGTVAASSSAGSSTSGFALRVLATGTGIVALSSATGLIQDSPMDVGCVSSVERGFIGLVFSLFKFDMGLIIP